MLETMVFVNMDDSNGRNLKLNEQYRVTLALPSIRYKLSVRRGRSGL